jgi:uncharacterized membrane protein YoaK (UPF0700 family)
MTPAERRDALVMALTAAAGAANVLSLTALGGVPTSVMTANVVLVGLSITRHQGTLGWHAGTALAAFAVGFFIAARLIAAGDRYAQDSARPAWPRPVTVALAVEALPLAGLLAGWAATGGRPGGAAQLTLCAAAAFAMGIQSAAVRALGVASLSSTFFTGTLTDVVRDLARGPRRWSRGASGLAALVAGAAAQGAVASFGAQRLAPLLPLVLVGAVAVLSLRVRGEDVPGDDDDGGRPSAH